MRRLFIPVVMIMVICFLTLSACSSSSTTTSQPSAATQAPAKTSAAPAATTKAPATTTTAAPPPTTTISTGHSAVATTEASTAGKKSGGVLRFIAYTADTSPGGWPADVRSVASMAYEGLLMQLATGELTPCLATSWDIADDHSSVTFHLRKGVKFTDGSDFNAEAVKFNYEAQLENKKTADWSTIEVIDDHTVKVNIAHWGPTTMLTFGDSGTSAIASPTAFAKMGLEEIRLKPVGTGAFMLDKFIRDASTEYVKNPNYWQPGKPYLDEYKNIVITDATTQLSAMQAGEGDATLCELGKMTNDFKKMGLEVDLAIQAVLTLVPDSDNADSPWSNKLVREAAEYAIDKDAIATGLGYGLWEAPYQIQPRGNPAYNPNLSIVRKYNPEKAKALLAEAGYPNGFQTSIIPFPGAASADATMAVVGFLGKVGIDVAVENVDFGKYFTISSDGWSNGLMFHPVPAYAWYIQTINSIFGVPETSMFFKKSWQRTDEYYAVLKAANDATNADAALTRAVGDLMVRDAMVIPIHEGGKSYAYQSYVKDAGFLTRGFANYFYPENIWLDK
ncbi:MAG: ABC transporter substrate-binding protein [Dehalococcoidales bacterium]|nr:ABC transporter substrate-binding protein [Dehalococcoidales bacterium]